MGLSTSHSDLTPSVGTRRRGGMRSFSMVWKLAIVVALPALPLAYLLVTTWTKDSSELQSSRLELTGSRASLLAMDVRQALNAGGANAPEAVTALEKALTDGGDPLKAKPLVEALKQASGAVAKASGDDRAKALATASTRLDELSKQVNEASGVVLDPDDVTYHLMLGYAQAMPEIGGHLHDLARIAADSRGSAAVGPDTYAEIMTLLAQALDDVAVVKTSMADVRKVGPALIPGIAPTEAWIARVDALVAEIKLALRQGKDAGAQLAALSGPIENASAAAYTEARRWAGMFDKNIGERLDHIEHHRWVLTGFILLTTSLSLYLLLDIWKTLRGGIVSMRLALERIGRGDLGSATEVDGKDEIALAMNAIYEMQQNLARTMTEVRSVSDSLGTAGGEIAAGNQDLASRTEQQAASLQQTAASIKQLEDAVQRNVDNAQKASELVATASRVAHDGGVAVKGVVDTMGSIQSSSQKISEITGVIDGIAFQTNILALNAAVEAARAGEQGRGFAVVASEVRALAKRSADAAREIKSLIEVSAEDVNQGARQVQGTTETIGEVVNAVERAAQLMEEIALASREQGQGISEVTKAVGQMDTVTQQNAALVEQTAAASESLKVQAHNLVEVISRFRIGTHSHAAA